MSTRAPHSHGMLRGASTAHKPASTVNVITDEILCATARYRTLSRRIRRINRAAMIARKAAARSECEVVTAVTAAPRATATAAVATISVSR